MAHILVIDDSMFQRKVITEILEKEGFSFSQAANGEEGLALAVSGEYDAIILDLLMPGLDGFGVLSEAKKRGIKTPIIVFTSDIQDTTIRQCRDLGAAGFLNKPVKRDEFLGQLREVLSR